MSKKFKVIVITLLLVFSVVQICMAENKKNVELNNIYPGAKHVVEYTVKDGENLSVIASKYKKQFENINNVIARIQYANNINEVIHPGQKLLIPLYE